MSLTIAPFEDAFEYIWTVRDQAQVRLRLSGDDVVYGTDGALISGSYSGYTVDYTVLAEDPNGPPILATQNLITVEGIPTEVIPLDVDQMDLLVPAVLISYSQILQNTSLESDFAIPLVVSGVDGARHDGTQASELFDISGSLAVVKARGGDDFVTTQDATERVYVSLGNGDDLFRGGDGEARVWGGNGDDTIYGGTGHDRMYGGTGRDWIEGQNQFDSDQGGNDLMKGGAGADFLRGHDGNDFLQGGEDADVLVANAGDDKLWGGSGRDAFVFNLEANNVAQESGANHIRDFDVAEDYLWIVDGYNGNSMDAQSGYDAFMAGAQQRDWGVNFAQDGLTITLRDVALDDLTVGHFVEDRLSDGRDFGYIHWADIDTDDWTLTL